VSSERKRRFEELEERMRRFDGEYGKGASTKGVNFKAVLRGGGEEEIATVEGVRSSQEVIEEFAELTVSVVLGDGVDQGQAEKATQQLVVFFQDLSRL
jgi:hypothetical protein